MNLQDQVASLAQNCPFRPARNAALPPGPSRQDTTRQDPWTAKTCIARALFGFVFLAGDAGIVEIEKAWWTTLRLPGRNSTAATVLSESIGIGMTKQR